MNSIQSEPCGLKSETRLLQSSNQNRAIQAVSAVGEESECSRRIARSIEHMLQNLDKPLSVAKLAASANVSQSHFFTLFKRHTGGAPIDFFIRLRMERARRLLETTSMNVKEVAAVLGYDDPFYFSRAFKSVNDIAPSTYRRTVRIDDNSFAASTSGLNDKAFPRSKNNKKHSIVHSISNDIVR